MSQRFDPPTARRAWQRFPTLPLAVALVLALVLALPSVRADAGLRTAFATAAAVLGAWSLVLWAGVLGWGQRFDVEFLRPARAHYIQGSVQLCIYAYWGWYFREVYTQLPLIVAQLAFYTAFDGLLSWSRGRVMRVGCGPLPIVLSTNVFLWFKPEWFVFQFALVATAALGKELLTWNRDGQRRHIFNPSAFALVLFAVVLLATDTTDATWAGRIADSLNRPSHIYVVIFLLGLVVQYFFSVTLMTLAAAATLAALSFGYTKLTGSYHFVTSNIPAPVFLGLHLLMTDPATSPRSNAGRVLFGTLYGVLTFVAFGILLHFDTYTVYDKLLPIPLLNLSVKWIDKLAASPLFAWFRNLDERLRAPRANLVHMGGWAVLFSAMLGTGFVEAPHEGSSFAFWKKALDEGRPNAIHGVINVLRFQGRNDDGKALNELGVIYMEGTHVKRDLPLALRYFGKACKLGDIAASANIAKLYLGAANPTEGVVSRRAFDQIERAAQNAALGTARAALCELVGHAYASGKGRPRDAARAREFFEAGCRLGHAGCCARTGRAEAPVLPALESAR